MDDDSPDAAREHFREGVRNYEAGDFAEAQRCFEASLALDAHRASTVVRLASTRLKQGAPDEVLVLLAGVLEKEPRHVDALGLRGTALAMLGFYPPALEVFDELLAVQPKHSQAWTMRGNILREMGRYDEAATAFANAVEESKDPEILGYYAAATASDTPPDSAPRAYVQSLFDNYANNYDAELVDTLNYRVPQLLVPGVASLGRRFANGLDLGCGTGLCAPLVKPLVDRLVGVDLSPQMLEQAKPLGLYDELHAADLVEFLAANETAWDFAIAADVFVYVGRLEPVFAQLAKRMPAGGIFCFSVEAHDGEEPLVLRPTRRFAHSEAYLRELAAAHGFLVQSLTREAIRDQRWLAIEGLCVRLERAGG